MLAIRPKTGEIACFYQFTPNDVYEFLLLLRRQQDHAPGFVTAEGREDSAAGAEVRVIHVGALDGLWHTQRNSSKLSGGHSS